MYTVRNGVRDDLGLSNRAGGVRLPQCLVELRRILVLGPWFQLGRPETVKYVADHVVDSTATHRNGLAQFRLCFLANVLLYEKLDSQSIRILKDGLREGASMGASACKVLTIA